MQEGLMKRKAREARRSRSDLEALLAGVRLEVAVEERAPHEALAAAVPVAVVAVGVYRAHMAAQIRLADERLERQCGRSDQQSVR